MMRQFGGRWSVTGFLITLSSLCGPLDARMDSLKSSLRGRARWACQHPQSGTGRARSEAAPPIPP